MNDSKKDNKIAKAFAKGLESALAVSDLSGQVENAIKMQEAMQTSYSQESVIENKKTSTSQEEVQVSLKEIVGGVEEALEDTQNTSIEDKTKDQNREPKRPTPKEENKTNEVKTEPKRPTSKEESKTNEIKTEPKRPTPKEESKTNEVKTEPKRPTPKETIETKEKEEEKKQSYNQSTYSQGYGY